MKNILSLILCLLIYQNAFNQSVDKEKLNSLIDSTYIYSIYTYATTTLNAYSLKSDEFNSTISSADKINKNSSATQNSVDSVYNALDKSINNLLHDTAKVPYNYGIISSLHTYVLFDNSEIIDLPDWINITYKTEDSFNYFTWSTKTNETGTSRTGIIQVVSDGYRNQCIIINQGCKTDELLTINCMPGKLYDLTTQDQRLSNTEIKITGKMNAKDFKTLSVDFSILEYIDLSEVEIVEYYGNQSSENYSSLSDENIFCLANEIPNYAFYYSHYLKTLILPESITSIGENAGPLTMYLKEIKIPDSVKSIGANAFEFNIFKTLTIPPNVTFLGEKAFASSYELDTIYALNTIPIDLTNSPNVFNGIQAKTEFGENTCMLIVPQGTINLYKNTPVWKDFKYIVESGNLDTLTISKDSVQLGSTGAFPDSITIYTNQDWNISTNNSWLSFSTNNGNGIKKIFITATNYNNEIDDRIGSFQITFNNQLISVPVNQAKFINSKEVYVEPGTLNSLITHSEGQTIKKLILHGKIDARDLKFIRDSILNLTEIDISQCYIEKYEGTEGTANKNYLYKTNYIPPYAFFNTKLTNIIINDSILGIEEFAFAKTAITSFTIPYTVGFLGGDIFLNCQKLTSITFDSNITYIPEKFCQGCTKLSSIILPHNCQTIDQYALSGCTKIDSIYIPENIKSIDPYAFANNLSLKSITCLSKTVPYADKLSSFTGIAPSTIKLYVKYEIYNDFSESEPWKNFNIIKLEGFTIDNDSLFFDATEPAPLAKTINISYNTNVNIYTNENWINYQLNNNTLTIDCTNDTLYHEGYLYLQGGYSFDSIKVVYLPKIKYLKTSKDTCVFSSIAGYDSLLVYSNIPWKSNLNIIYKNNFDKCNYIHTDSNYTCNGYILLPKPDNYTYVINYSHIFITSQYLPGDTIFVPIKIVTDTTTIIKDTMYTYGGMQHIYNNELTYYNYNVFSSPTEPWLYRSDTALYSEYIVTLEPNYTQNKRTTTFSYNTEFSPTWVQTVVQFPIILNKTINNTSGNLHSQYSPLEMASIEELTLKGTINALDIYYMRDSMKSLKVLNLENVTIEGFEGNIENYVLKEYVSFDKNTLPPNAFKYFTTLEKIVLPKTLSKIGNNAFEGCEHLDTIIITKQSVDGITVINSFNFFKRQNCVLYVPYGTLNQYKNDYVWKSFKKIIEITPSKIENSIESNSIHLLNQEGFIIITNNDSKIIGLALYSVDGKKLKYEKTNTLDITNFGTGVYVLMVYFTNEIMAQRIIIN